MLVGFYNLHCQLCNENLNYTVAFPRVGSSLDYGQFRAPDFSIHVPSIVS